MAFRKRMSRRKSRRVFSRTAHAHKRNRFAGPMRGGIRL